MVLFGFVLGLGWSTTVPANDRLPRHVVKVLNKYQLSGKGLSVYVQDVAKRRPLLLRQANTARNPASVMKLVTTLVALETLGPAYQWHTEIWTDGLIENGRLHGDLYFRGGGDPYLLVEDFWRLLRRVREKGLSAIDGDIVIDRSYFDLPAADPNAFDGKPYRAYNVTPDAMLLGFKVTRFGFHPRAAAGNVTITTEPPAEGLALKNNLKLISDRCKGRHFRVRMRVKRKPSGSEVSFSGRYPDSCGSWSINRSVYDPEPYFDAAFKNLWRETGGSISGTTRSGVVPETAKRLLIWRSKPLTRLIHLINKYSNNVMARQLLLTLGAEYGGRPGTLEKGRQVIADWFASASIKAPDLYVDNGAGLSRKGRISAQTLGELLIYAWQQPTMPEFVSSLPLSAIDGTLRNRFHNHDLLGKLHMKTGSIKYAEAIAGYMHTQTGRVLAIVMMHNSPKLHSDIGAQVQDALLEWLYQTQ